MPIQADGAGRVIDLQLDLRGVDALLTKNRRFPGILRRAVVNSLRRTVRRTATVVKQEIRSGSGIGRTIWGKNASGLTKQGLVSIIRPRVSGDSIETGLSFRGIPKLIEEGGRIKAHRIKGKTARGFLAFEGRKGLILTKSVQHPGSTVRAHGFGGSALRRNERMIADDVNAAIRKAVEETYGQ